MKKQTNDKLNIKYLKYSTKAKCHLCYMIILNRLISILQN